MNPVSCRLRLDPRDVDQQLRARITAGIESVIPDLRRHAAQPTAARARHQSAVARAAHAVAQLGCDGQNLVRIEQAFGGYHFRRAGLDRSARRVRADAAPDRRATAPRLPRRGVARAGADGQALTNDPRYWLPGTGRETNGEAFRIHQGRLRRCPFCHTSAASPISCSVPRKDCRIPHSGQATTTSHMVASASWISRSSSQLSLSSVIPLPAQARVARLIVMRCPPAGTIRRDACFPRGRESLIALPHPPPRA